MNGIGPAATIAPWRSISTWVNPGGISSTSDLSALAGLRQVNLTGVIVGKALYEERLDIAGGQAALDAGGETRGTGH